MNIAKLMKQAQQMQAGLAAKQEELANQTVEASAGGGKVTVTATCAGDVLSIKIDPSIVDPADVDFLEELVLSAVQEAIATGKDKTAAEMKKLTGGLGIPGTLGFQISNLKFPIHAPCPPYDAAPDGRSWGFRCCSICSPSMPSRASRTGLRLSPCCPSGFGAEPASC